MTEPTKTRPGDQPLPNGGQECVQDALIRLIEDRKQLGIQRYGSALMTHNGRDAGRDMVEEALDLTVYAMQVAMELRDLRAAVGGNTAPAPATMWTPSPAEVMDAAEWARQGGKASATIEALTANAGCSEHPNAGSVGPYCLACVIVPPSSHQAPAADEDAQRAARRDSLLNLLARLQRGGMTAEEKVALRQHVEAEVRECDTARTEVRRLGLMVDEYGQGARQLSEKLRKARRAADLLADSHRRAEQAEELQRVAHETSNRAEVERARLEQEAVAATQHVLELKESIERVRAFHLPVKGDGGPYCNTCSQQEQQAPPAGWWVPYPCPTVRALEGTEQLTTEQPAEAGTCTATLTDPLKPDTVHRCVQHVGHYDASRVPDWPEERDVNDGPDPGGWHTTELGKRGVCTVWSDDAEGASPHGTETEG